MRKLIATKQRTRGVLGSVCSRLCSSWPYAAPPPVIHRPCQREAHGHVWQDPFRWNVWAGCQGMRHLALHEHALELLKAANP